MREVFPLCVAQKRGCVITDHSDHWGEQKQFRIWWDYTWHFAKWNAILCLPQHTPHKMQMPAPFAVEEALPPRLVFLSNWQVSDYSSISSKGSTHQALSPEALFILRGRKLCSFVSFALGMLNMAV